MSDATDSKLDAFQDLLDQWGFGFVYSVDSVSRKALVGDGYKNETIALTQIVPGEQFMIRFLASAWATLPTPHTYLTNSGTKYYIEVINPVLPGDIILTLVCRIR
jgi:hypothetical protein